MSATQLNERSCGQSLKAIREEMSEILVQIRLKNRTDEEDFRQNSTIESDIDYEAEAMEELVDNIWKVIIESAKAMTEKSREKLYQAIKNQPADNN